MRHISARMCRFLLVCTLGDLEKINAQYARLVLELEERSLSLEPEQITVALRKPKTAFHILNPTRSIRARIGLAFAGVTLTLSLLMASAVGQIVRKQLEHRTGEHLRSLAQQMAVQLDITMYERFLQIELLATGSILQEPGTSVDEKREILNDLVDTYPIFSWVGLTDSSGQVVAASDSIIEGTDISQRPVFVSGRQGTFVGDVHEAVLLAPYFLNPGGEPVHFVDISTPIYSRDGTLIGVLAAHLSWIWADQVREMLLSTVEASAQIDLIILRADGVVLLGPAEFIPLQSTIDLAGLGADPASGPGYVAAAWENGHNFFTGYDQRQGYETYPGLRWIVLARQDRATALAEAQQIQQRIFGLGAVFGLIFAAISWIIAARTVKPLIQIAAAAQRIRSGDRTSTLPVLKGRDEITLLSASLSNLFTDLTQQIEATARADEARRRSEDQYSAIFRESLDVIALIDGFTGRIISANPAVERILGFKIDEVIGQHMSVLFPTETLSSHQDFIERLLIYGSVVQALEFYRADGTICLMDLTATLITWGSQRAILTTLRDVNEREEAEKALRENEALLKTVITNAPVFLFALDATGHFTFAEGRSAALIGHSVGSLIGHRAVDVFRSYFDLTPFLEAALIGAQQMVTIPIVDSIVEIQFVPLRSQSDRNRYDVIGIMTDITDRKKAADAQMDAELARLELQKEREMMQLKDSFISMMSHEFRTPLTVVISSASLLNDYYERLSPEQRAVHFQKIETQTTYMTEMLDDILLLSRARAGRLDFAPQEMDITALCQEIFQEFERTENSAHRLKLITAADVGMVHVDGKLVRHILHNLLSNAIKYSPDGGEICLELARETDQIVIRVRDQGVGIPEKDQKLLFEPFARASNATAFSGTGLGLSIVKESVDVHGGTITLSSQEGHGTTFIVTLRVAFQETAR
jgi:PAS domain S-box-containing protein